MLLGVILLFVQFFLVSKSLRIFKFSPVYIYIFFGAVTMVLSVIYFYFYEKKFSLFNLDDVSEKQFLNALSFYVLSLNAFMTGVLFYFINTLKKTRILFNFDIDNQFDFNFNSGKKERNIIVYYFIFLFFFFLFLYGKSLFIRDEYPSFEENKGFVIILSFLSFIGCLLSSALYTQYKKTSLILLFILLLLNFGTGSRMGFIFLLIYGLIAYFSKEDRGVFKKIKLVIFLIFSLFYMAVLIQVRYLPEHGIIPYLTYLLTLDPEIFDTMMFNIYYLLVFGYFVTIETMQTASASWDIIYTNINPLPGSFVGWYEYSSSRRINIYAPYSTHGEAFAMGKTFTFFFFFFIGIIFTNIDKFVRKMFKKQKNLKALILVLLTCLHIFYSFEYNMRSSLRYIYYSYFYLLMLFFVGGLINSIPKR